MDEVGWIAVMVVSEEAGLHALDVRYAEARSFGFQRVEHRLRHIDRDHEPTVPCARQRERAGASAEVDKRASLVEAELA